LSEISRDYLALKDQYKHSSFGFNQIEALQSSKGVLRKVYSQIDDEISEIIKMKKEMKKRWCSLRKK